MRWWVSDIWVNLEIPAVAILAQTSNYYISYSAIKVKYTTTLNQIISRVVITIVRIIVIIIVSYCTDKTSVIW